MSPEESVAVAVKVGELGAKLDGFDSKLDAIHASLKEDIGKVEAQTTRTNGRVTSLEKRYAELKGVGLALVALSPFLLFALQKLFD